MGNLCSNKCHSYSLSAREGECHKQQCWFLTSRLRGPQQREANSLDKGVAVIRGGGQQAFNTHRRVPNRPCLHVILGSRTPCQAPC